MKTKKIEIYYKGEYICTTMRSRTCKEALLNFIENPYVFDIYNFRYKTSYYSDLLNNCIDSKKIRARIKKEND